MVYVDPNKKLLKDDKSMFDKINEAVKIINQNYGLPPMQFRMSKKQVLELLDKIRNKGGCIYCEHTAERMIWQIKPYLTEKQFTQLKLEFNHFTQGESPAMFYDVCKRIKEELEKDGKDY